MYVCLWAPKSVLEKCHELLSLATLAMGCFLSGSRVRSCSSSFGAASGGARAAGVCALGLVCLDHLLATMSDVVSLVSAKDGLLLQVLRPLLGLREDGE